jgi:hypothetical protein
MSENQIIKTDPLPGFCDINTTVRGVSLKMIFFQIILELLASSEAEIGLSLFMGDPRVAHRQAHKTQPVVKIYPGVFWYTLLPLAAINQFVLK